MNLEEIFQSTLPLAAKRCLEQLYYRGFDVKIFSFHSDVAFSTDTIWLAETDNDEYYEEVMASLSIKKVAIIRKNLKKDFDMWSKTGMAMIREAKPKLPPVEEESEIFFDGRIFFDDGLIL